MVAAIITALHGIALLGVFFWKLRTSGFADAALSAGFIIIIFSVGWTLAGFVSALVFEPKGLAEWMNRDTISLVLVTLGEIVFYTVLLRLLGKKTDKHAQA
jgi:hypothetical protein